MELLAPAGSESALIAAVQSGADAVYIGGSKFSARQAAKNFSVDDMKRWIDYCHIRGVTVHIAANILIKEKEKKEFLDYVGVVNQLGGDALIIQDIGMAAEIRKCYPDLPLHASTQMTIASLEGVLVLAKLGFTRVVLSRELSKKEIEFICKHSPIETEIFVHGALCMCYSGQCLMSSIIGGRSGNRGMCAQPCRLPYELIQKDKTITKGYLLSPKDLALIDEMETLERLGVTSLKIEGRLKRPEYVSAVTQTYCKYKNFTANVSCEDWNILKNAFNRSGFTKGYFENKIGINMMSIQNSGNVSDNSFTTEAINRCKPNANHRKIPINIYACLEKGKSLVLTLIDTEENAITVSGEVIAEKAINCPITKERLKEQLIKLGGTPFSINSIEILIEDEIAIPVSEINSIRRKAVLALEEKRCRLPFRRTIRNKKNDCEAKSLNRKILTAQVLNMKQAEAVLEFDIPLIYAPIEIAEKIKSVAPNTKVIVMLPPICKDDKKVKYKKMYGVLISNISELYRCSKDDCFGSFRLNIYNNESIKFYKNLKCITVSPELNISEIKELKQYIPLEVIVYGRLPLMVMENCPKKANYVCNKGEHTYLKDRIGECFPLICSPMCYAILLNSKPLYMADKMKDLLDLPISMLRIDFTIESKEECTKILSQYCKALAGDENIEKMTENTFTRGHYYRGVE